jgi:hypothetical protein
MVAPSERAGGKCHQRPEAGIISRREKPSFGGTARVEDRVKVVLYGWVDLMMIRLLLQLP